MALIEGALGIIRISMLLGLGGLLTGMCVLDLQDAAHLVVGIILHPAVGIPHLRDTAHAVIGVRSLTAWRRGADPLGSAPFALVFDTTLEGWTGCMGGVYASTAQQEVCSLWASRCRLMQECRAGMRHLTFTG